MRRWELDRAEQRMIKREVDDISQTCQSFRNTANERTACGTEVVRDGQSTAEKHKNAEHNEKTWTERDTSAHQPFMPICKNRRLAFQTRGELNSSPSEALLIASTRQERLWTSQGKVMLKTSLETSSEIRTENDPGSEMEKNLKKPNARNSKHIEGSAQWENE